MIQHILIVEDNSDDQVLLSHVVRWITKHRSDVARDGLDAILKAEGKDYDLVLVDVNLPDRTGWEVVETLRQARRYATIPIIAVTAFDDTGARLRSAEVGCDAYLTKPVDIDKMAEVLNSLLGNFN